MTVKIFAVLIVKNESAVLERCLESLEGVDGIYITDTGSTDNTVEIAERYGCHVTSFPWVDDFAAARNFASSQVEDGFILSIDADEQLLTHMIDIRSQLETLGDHDALTVNMQWNENHSHKVPRIFKAGVKWEGRIHEYVVCNAKPSDIVIKYEKSPAHDLDPDRNLRILLSDKENVRSQFYLANEYYDRGNIEGALTWYKIYLTKGTWRYEVSEANFKVAKCLWQLGRGDQARNYCLQAILGNPNFSEALRFMAEMSWEKEAEVWKKFAVVATDEDVLFVRGNNGS